MRRSRGLDDETWVWRQSEAHSTDLFFLYVRRQLSRSQLHSWFVTTGDFFDISIRSCCLVRSISDGQLQSELTNDFSCLALLFLKFISSFPAPSRLPKKATPRTYELLAVDPELATLADCVRSTERIYFDTPYFLVQVVLPCVECGFLLSVASCELRGGLRVLVWNIYATQQ